jgi:hypothetical protein
MEISKDDIIFTVIEKQAVLYENNEWIINIYDDNSLWTELEFNNFVSVMRSLKYTEKIEKEYLEVSTNNEEILKIIGLPHIIKYCMSDNHKILHHEWIRKKEIVSDTVPNLFDFDIDIKINKISDIVEPDKWDDLRKKYKIIKQISYTDKNDIQYIANIVKSSNDEFYTLKQSGIIKSSQKYEFSIIVNNKDNIIPSIVRMIQSLSLSAMILSKPQQKLIIDSYYELIKKDVFVSAYNKGNGEIPLLTPKPVTLERTNMIDPSEYGAISILSEYTVTEKADGERLLMYINEVGNVYLINNTFRVEDTGLKASADAYNSLIDGEYITCNKRRDTTKKGLYAAFDIYYIKNKKVTDLPLIDKNASRYKYLKSLEGLINSKDNAIEFIVKNHITSDNILLDCKNILENVKSYPYEIDGLIFTPAKLAVYSYYANKAVPITDNMKWDRVFKWKPVEQNTIDFLIQEGKEIMIDGQKYKEIKLYVGYNASQWEQISPEEGLRLKYDKDYAKQNRTQRTSYIPKLFKPTIYYSPGIEIAHIKINHNGELRADNGDKIEGESIVEFKYILDEKIPIGRRWIPLRVREDKTRIYKQGKLSKTANELGVAINIWRSIHLPVTTGMIVGNEPVFSKDAPDDMEDRLLETDDIYYSREIPRDSLLSVHMLNFHNQGIKRTLYTKADKKGALLELACGQGGDMNRWVDANYNFVLGVDLVKNNIYNPRYGAYSRMLKRRKQYMTKVEGAEKINYIDMVFVVGDCTANLKDGTAAALVNDPESEKILKLVLNKQKSVQNHLKYIAAKGANGFDAVSCMFAVHYFFQTEEKLNGFLMNVSSNLKKGGIFFCTFMDGKKVEDAITSAGGDMVEGRKLFEDYTNGVPVWCLIRRYNKDAPSKYNKKVDVFIENTQRLIPEYLVDYDLLVEKAKTYNLELSETEMFGDTFNKLKDTIPDDLASRQHLDDDILALDKDEVQKQFSFLNRWVIFKKK